MSFEEFEKKIRSHGYGIAALNHYVIDSQWYIYCAVLNSDKEKAFQEEGKDSTAVFQKIYERIIESAT